MLQEYLIIGKDASKTITLGYDADGDLERLIFDGDFTPEQRTYGLRHAPVRHEQLAPLAKELKWKVKPLEFDLSFENFYELYGNKVGKKRAESRWKRLSREQKVKALLFIEKYDNQLKQQPGVQKKYPESYLNAEPWND